MLVRHLTLYGRQPHSRLPETAISGPSSCKSCSVSSNGYHRKNAKHANSLCLAIALTAAVQLLLWIDNKKAALAEPEGSLETSQEIDSPPLQESDVDEKKAVREREVALN